ncbi:unnamed protein product [Rhizophagus irregularis]|nr:unnamed protein product [Rhizophagus irregularis]
MACSKFFSGDLSELLNEVIQYFHYDYKTLHSCILVNRLWCRLAISLLWEDPFSIKSPKNYRFIEIYLSNLSDDDKTRLNEYVIHSGLFPSNTLFNYPKFIKHLDIYKVYYSIEMWAYTNLPTSPTSQILGFITELIFRSLFIIFIENEVNLHSFGVIVDGYKEFECFGAAFGLVLQNTNFVYNIKSLTLDFDSEITDNITKFLEFLCSNCNLISSLYFLLPIINNGQILPFKLEYLNLVLATKGSDLEVFLKSSQNTYIKKLLIRRNDENSHDILPYIKEYIMKKKRVKSLAILELFHREVVDLFSLKDEVKEFQLYDIQVLNYNDSAIGVYNFIKETY